MGYVRRFLAVLLVSLLYLSSASQVFAEVQEFSAEGEYRLGDRDSREFAKTMALSDAKRKIIEQVGVYVESYTNIEDFKITSDNVVTAANALIKIKDEKVEFHENGTICRSFVVATIDTENIVETLKKIEASRDSINKDKDKDKEIILKIAGIEEFNGHYYKIFNDSMSWFDADARCKKIGGYLVTISSIDEQAAVQSMIFKRGNKNFYWTGGFRVSDQWQWNTHEKFEYTNWGRHEPNNEFGNEFILVMFRSGRWADCPAEGINHIPDLDFLKLSNSCFVCEWDSYENIKDAG